MKLPRPVVVASLFLCAVLAIHLVFWWQERHRIAAGYPDFTIFYTAGTIVRQGMGHLLYDEPTEWRVQQEFASGVTVRQASLPYLHAPYEALFFVPFSKLPYAHAYLGWNFINLAVLLFLPSLLRPHFPALQQYPRWLWTLAFVAFFPAFFTMLQGQDAILLLLLYCLAFVALKKGSDFTAGCCLALGLFRFHLVTPLVVILLLAKKWKFFAGFVIVAAGLAAVSVAVAGWSSTIHYPQYVWWLEQHTGRGILLPRDTPNLRGLIENALTGWTSPTTILVVIALSSALAIYLAFRTWSGVSQNASDRFDLAFAFSLVATSLVSYHTFVYDFSLLLLPALIVLNRLAAATHVSSWRRVSQLVPLVALFFTPIYLIIWFRWKHSNLMGLVLMFWAWTLWQEILRVPRNA